MMCRDVELVGKKVGWELGGAVFGGHPRVLVGSGKGGDGVGGEPVRGQLRPARLTSHAEAGQSTHGGGSKQKSLTVCQTSFHTAASHRQRAFPWYGFSHVSGHAPHA